MILLALFGLADAAAWAGTSIKNVSITVGPASGPLLPADRSATGNWQMAGLLSIGGIPNRTTQCGATISPRGGGLDDTNNIDTAITNCAAGQFVGLASGTFTIAEGSYILLNKAVSLRGQGAGNTILSRATNPACTGPTGCWTHQTDCSSGAWGASLGCNQQGTNPTPMIIVSPLSRFVANPQTACALTADGGQGTTSITVSSGCSGNFSPGQVVLLDEASGAGWVPDIEYAGTNIWADSTNRVTYHIHQCPAHFTGSIGAVSGTTATLTVGSPSCGFFTNGAVISGTGISNTVTITGGSGSTWSVSCSSTCPTVGSETMTSGLLISGDDCGALPPNSSNCGVMNQGTYNADHMTNELKLVSAVAGNVVTFDSPLTISYRTNHGAAAYTFSTAFLQKAGVENLTSQNSDDNGIEWDYCAYCWSSGVEQTHWLGRGLEMQGCFRCQHEMDYVHEGVWCVPGGAGYDIDEQFATSETLIENSISRACNKVNVTRAAGAGSVYAYNYFDDGYIAGTTGWVEIGINASHLVGSHHALFEGNWGWNSDSDNTHGNAIYITHFRNDVTGIREAFTGEDGVLRDDSASNCNGSVTSPQRGLAGQLYAWWTSDIGNVIGTPGCTVPANGWRLNGTFATNQNIHMRGWDSQNVVGNNSFADPNMTTIYPAVGPNCPAASNCSTIDSNNWIQWPASTTSVFAAHSNVTLSNSNRTATNGTSTGADILVSDVSFVSGASQKIYDEFTCTNALGNLGFGYANAGNLSTYLGQDSNSTGYYNNGLFISGNANIQSGQWDGCVTGDTVGIMLDATVSPMQLFIRTFHSGAWNAKWNVTTEAQPTAGGYNITASNVTSAQTLFPTLSVKNTAEAGTICGNAACGVSPSGLPTGAVWFDTTQNFSQTPPAAFASSLYLSSKPSFFNAGSGYPWPWVTPEDGPAAPLQSGPAGCGGTCSGLPAKARWDSCVAASTVTAACIIGTQP